jgi:threonine/homoserine/homoserine lactone efflux protein
MAFWQQFLVIAGVHFLALLSPGPDFFLIVRSALVNGARVATGVCVGIALANGVYIALAIGGVAVLQQLAGLFVLLKWAGCAYLAWLGWRFLDVRGTAPASVERVADTANNANRTDAAHAARADWWRELRTGFLSGILNPKNSLFYASLFSLGFARETALGVQIGYGLWMFAAVLAWDCAIARAAGHPRVVRRFMAHVRTLERVTGVVLLGIAAAIAGSR